MYKNVLAYAGINIKLDLDKICKNTVYKKCYRNLFIFSFNLNLQNEGAIFTNLCYFEVIYQL